MLISLTNMHSMRIMLWCLLQQLHTPCSFMFSQLKKFGCLDSLSFTFCTLQKGLLLCHKMKRHEILPCGVKLVLCTCREERSAVL